MTTLASPTFAPALAGGLGLFDLSSSWALALKRFAVATVINSSIKVLLKIFFISIICV
jgi:hypothetical protein